MAAVNTSLVAISLKDWTIGGRLRTSMNLVSMADVRIRVVRTGSTLARLYRNATLMASVPIVSVSMNE